MADIYSGISDYKEQDMPSATPQKKQSQISLKILKWIILIICLVLAAELVWFLGITPFRPFTRIDVSGLAYYDRDSLLAYAGITPQSSFVFTNARDIERSLSRLHQFETVNVVKRYPGRLEINIQSRNAAVLAFTQLDNRTIPMIFDRHGVLFHIGTGFPGEFFSSIPVISGVYIQEPELGMKLPARLLPFLDNLDTVRLNAPELLTAVSEIRIDRRSSEGYDFTLFLSHHKTQVRLSGFNEDILRYSLLVADVLAVREPGINIIDFRGGMASYFQGGYL